MKTKEIGKEHSELEMVGFVMPNRSLPIRSASIHQLRMTRDGAGFLGPTTQKTRTTLNGNAGTLRSGLQILLDDLEVLIPEEPKKEQRVKHTSNDKHNIKRVKSMLEYLSGHLPSDEVEDYVGWVSIGMAIKSAVDDGILEEDEGLDYWGRMSERAPGGAEDDIKWETFKPNRTGLGKLFKMAWNLGWRSEKKVFHFKEGEYQTIADEITDLVATTHDADHLSAEEAEKFSVYRYLGKIYEVCEGKISELPKDRLRGRISLRCVLLRKSKRDVDVITPPDRDLIGMCTQV